MTSNYNEIFLPFESDGKFKVGDIFKSNKTSGWRIQKFDGLKIKNIYYWQFGIKLNFDFDEWKNNCPIIKYERNISKTNFNWKTC